MRNPKYFKILNEYAVFRPTGKVSLERAVLLVTEGIAYARSLNIRKLLIDITNLRGFESPSVTTRYYIIQEWRRAAGNVRVAIVAKPEIIYHQKFGTTVAGNRRFKVDIFTTEEDALKWLESFK